MLSRSQGHSGAGRSKSIEKSNDLIGNRIFDLPACSIVPQPNTLRRATEFYIQSIHIQCSYAGSTGAVRMPPPPPRQKGDPISKYVSGLGRKKNVSIISDRGRNQDWLCWRKPTTKLLFCSAISSAIKYKKRSDWYNQTASVGCTEA
jgi:hypothetical protein